MKVFGRTLVLVVLISVAIGMGSAAVLSSYGVISGTADVEGPTFYAGENEDLLINEKPKNSERYTVETDGDSLEIKTLEINDLEPSEWYDMQIEMFAEVNMTQGNENKNDGVELDVRYIAADGDKESICQTQFTDLEEGKTEDLSETCSKSIDEEISGFVYRLSAVDNSDTKTIVKVEANPEGSTGFEVNAQ